MNSRINKEVSVYRPSMIDRLSSAEQLDHLLSFPPAQGRAALGVLLALLGAALAWCWLGRIPVEVEGEGVLLRRGGDLYAVLLLPAAQTRRVEPGMASRLVPAAPRPGEPVVLSGTVARVAPSPVSSAAGLRRLLGTEELAAEWAGTGARIPVEISLARREERALPAGTRTQGTILLGEERPLDLLLPPRRSRRGV